MKIRAEGPEFHKFVIGRIVPRSAAAEAGIQSGDIIESIDSHPAEKLTLTEIRSMLALSKARYSIGLIRGTIHLRITLQLRPLL
jgi:C-terminal processing protease CtpA/Prc